MLFICMIRKENGGECKEALILLDFCGSPPFFRLARILYIIYPLLKIPQAL